MSADYTTVGLLANCRRRGFLPSGSGTTDAQLLEVLTEQLRTHVTAFLKGLREEYIIATLTISVTSATVPVPARAVGAALRTVGWLEADGSVTPLVRIEPERRNNFPVSDSTPAGYMVRGNNLLLVPAATTGTIVVTYQQRPGQLVLPTACAAITGIDTGTKTLSFTSLPNTFLDSEVYDFVPPRPNFDAIQLDTSVDLVTPTTMVLTDAVPAGLHTGDYVCIATETCIPQVVLEAHDLIAQAAASQLAQSSGSSRKDAIADALKALREQLTVLLSPRVDGSSRPIISKSRIGYRRW